jgi:glycosidase
VPRDGALAGLEELVAAARRLGIAVLLDLPSTHTNEEADRVLRSWLERGVAGFRMDVSSFLAEEAGENLRDSVSGAEPAGPRVHELLRRWPELGDGSAGQAIVVGDAWVTEPGGLAALDGAGLALARARFAREQLASEPLRRIVEAMEADASGAAWPVWTGSSEDDGGRPATRWAGGGEDRVRVALLLLLTLRGTPILCAGDGLALAAGERGDPASVVHLVRDLIGLRRDESDLHRGEYASLPAPAGAWAYRRGDGHLVALNLSAAPVAVDGLTGRVLICTQRGRDGERVRGTLGLGPWEGAVLAAG